jgi:nucleotide-binding universal stress UspA family protein
MIEALLVCLDSSTRAPGVLAVATEIAERFDARMILYRAIVVPPEFPAAAAYGDAGDPLPKILERTAIDELRLLAKDNPRAIVEPPIVGIGQPWRAILETADRLNVDLVVVGSHGYHGLDRVLGTTAAKVANHARRNVLVVHTGAMSERA